MYGLGFHYMFLIDGERGRLRKFWGFIFRVHAMKMDYVRDGDELGERWNN